MRLNLFAALILTLAAPGVGSAQTDSARWAPFIATTDSLRLVVGVPGLSYAIVERGRVVAEGGLGYSDVAAKTPATGTTLYPIASLTKTIAAVTLFQLVQAGLRDLDQRMSGAQSRWSAGKNLSWEPLRIERVCEVRYDHLQGDRFRHATTFLRWRPDKPPGDCRYDQLEEIRPYQLKQIFAPRSK